jgi:hypothetical protein
MVWLFDRYREEGVICGLSGAESDSASQVAFSAAKLRFKRSPLRELVVERPYRNEPATWKSHESLGL